MIALLEPSIVRAGGKPPPGDHLNKPAGAPNVEVEEEEIEVDVEEKT